MLISNNPKKRHYWVECSTIILNMVFLLLTGLLVSGIYRWSMWQQEISSLEQKLDLLQVEYGVLYREKAESDKLNESLSELVSAQTLEDTIREQELLVVSMPTGVPINGTAVIEDYQATDVTVFQVSQGIYIIASGAGEVTYVGEDEEYGYAVHITHLDGYVSIYRVDESATVAEGQEVERGSILFVMDEVGTFAYQILYNDQLINPLELMDISG